MGEAGEVGRGSGQNASHRASQAPSLSRKVEGLGPRMGLWNTRIQAVSPWASLAGCPATVGNHLSGPQGNRGGPLLP